MQALNERIGADLFFIADSVFNADARRPGMLAEEILRRKLKIRWTAFFAPTGIGAEDAALWKASGLDGIELGAEALSPATLASYRKFFSVDDAIGSVRACAEADLPCFVYLIFGGPGETPQTLDETIACALSLPRAVFSVFIGMRIFPGTELEQIALREGIVAPGESLIEPRFYFSPKLPLPLLEERCADLAKRSNWLVAGKGMAAREKIAGMLRARGAKGSLWQLLRPAE
jgi:radical SAM superfamily enzyme YgiQ (UPF0313 family)